MKKFEEFQNMSKYNMDVAAKSFGEINKNVQEIASEMSDYSKKAIEENAAAVEKIFTAKSFEKAIEIQTDYARQAYDDYMAGAGKIGEIYVEMAKEFYKPVEKAMSPK